MSDLQYVADLRRQITELDALVAEAEQSDDIVAKMSFASRQQALADMLMEMEETDANVGEVAVLFDGKPVHGTSSIDASFAAQALLHFQGIITRLFSVSLKGQLSKRGKIGGADLAQLSIRGLATGSFGFVLEENEAAQTSAVKTPLREAIDQAAELFVEFTQEDEDEFLIEVDDINPRIFNELGKFFKHMEANEATLKTCLMDKSLSFDRAAISRAHKRISNSNVNINDEIWIGTLVGLTPIKRAFEFRKDGESAIVSGKFGERMSQDYLEKIESREGPTLGSRYRASVEVGTLRKPDGSISTTHTVTDLEEIE
jgi:hypothetical protein